MSQLQNKSPKAKSTYNIGIKDLIALKDMKQSQLQGGPNSKDIFERPNLDNLFWQKIKLFIGYRITIY